MKKFLPDLIAILAFIILSFAYFFPADIEGRILFQHDTAAGVGAGQESKEYLERTGERTRWTNSIFGGMPTYQMSPSYDSTTSLKGVEKVYRRHCNNCNFFLLHKNHTRHLEYPHALHTLYASALRLYRLR